MKLRYDSDTENKSPNELIFRLRLWSDPELKSPPILMASERQDWKGKSVVNASEDIYGYFLSQRGIESFQLQDSPDA